MDAEWSVAAAEDDPIVVVPWHDEASALAYIDLRQEPARIDEIAEAHEWPEIREALLRLNAEGSLISTAKCDAWELSEEEKQLDFGAVSSGFGAYFDALSRDLSSFLSLQQQIAAAQRLAGQASILPPENARAEFVVRPASWHEQQGYSITIYVYGYGEADAAARSQWSEALMAVVDCVVKCGRR